MSKATTNASRVPAVVLEALRAGPAIEGRLEKRYRAAMRLRLAMKVTIWTVMGLALVTSFVLTGLSPRGEEPPAWMLPAILIAVLLPTCFLFMYLLRGTHRAFQRACDAGDEPSILVHGGVLAATSKGMMRPLALLIRATALAAIEKDREALAALDEIDPRTCPAPFAARLRAAQAWYLARLGEPARSLELVDELTKTRAVPAAFVDGTLGAALVHAGRAEEAIAPLQRASVADREKACMLFHLAEAQRMTGHADDAQGTYERATTAGGSERWRRAAREALKMETYRHTRRA